jgi:hypothetical protein
MSAARLRELAASRAIHPDTPISQDGTNWVPASKARGLFLTSFAPAPLQEAPASAREAAQPPRDEPGRQQGPSPVAPDGLLPLIRLKRKLWKTEILALYDSHAILGTRSFSEPPFTEELCQAAGEAALTGLCHRVSRIEYDEIQHVREEVPRRGQNPQHKLLHRFEIHGEDEQLVFSLPVRQVGHVREYLAKRLAGRYQWREGRGSPWIEGVPPNEAKQEAPPQGNPVAGLLVLSVFILAAGAAIFLVARVVGVVWCLFGILGVGYSCLSLWGPRQRASGSGGDNARRKRARRETANQPLRSAPAGWALKLGGVLYWLMMASPLTDGLAELMARWHLGPWGAVVWWFLWSPSVLLIYFGYRLCQKPFSPGADLDDRRKPILFLRPFTDDARLAIQDDAGISLQPGGLLPKWAGLRGSGNAFEFFQLGWETERAATGQISFSNTVFACSAVRLLRMVLDRDVGTSEESLARFFERYNPVVAIGKPGESLATPGARRGYVPHDSWQEHVRRAISEAHAVVIQPGRTEGVRWELNQIRELRSPETVLLCMVSFWKEPQAYEELTRLVWQETGIKLPRVIPFLRTPVFIQFQRGWQPQVQAVSYTCPLLWPLTGNAVDLDYCLRPFLWRVDAAQGSKTAAVSEAGPTADGGRPRSPKWVEGSGTAALKFAGLFLAVALMYVPIVGADYLIRKAWTTLPSSSTNPSPGPQAKTPRDSVIDSAWTTLKGRTLPYSLSIPASMVKAERVTYNHEHNFKSLDDRYYVSVEAVATAEKASNVIERSVQAARAQLTYKEVRLESTKPVDVDGAEWTEARVLLTGAGEDGTSFSMRQKLRAFSDRRGTILIATGEIVDADQSYGRITDKIMASVKMEKDRGFDGRIVGRWESVDAPVRVVQEFGADGQSEMSTLGTTTQGTYTLDGDDIDWRSGTLVVKAKVKFSSTTEMELNDDAGQRVRYTKIGEPGSGAEGREPVGVLPVGADGNPLNFDFETGTLKDWTTGGDAFVGQPIRGDTIFGRLRHLNTRSQHQGRYWIGTYERNGDFPRGKLTSVPFKVTHPSASFLIGGGAGPGTCVELVRKSTREVFSRTCGQDNETMSRATVDLRPVAGEEIFIRLVDQDVIGWGHLNFDDFRFHATTPVAAAAPAPATAVNGAIDLLKLINPRRDAVAGRWKWDTKAALITGDRPYDRLEIRYDVPAEYRLTVVASCASHGEALHLGLVTGLSQVVVSLDNQSKTVTNLHEIDHQPFKDENGSLHRGPVLRDGEPNVITCEVRADRLSVDCNGERVIDWTGGMHRLSMNLPWGGRNNRYLMIGSTDTHFEISKLELSPL